MSCKGHDRLGLFQDGQNRSISQLFENGQIATTADLWKNAKITAFPDIPKVRKSRLAWTFRELERPRQVGTSPRPGKSEHFLTLQKQLNRHSRGPVEKCKSRSIPRHTQSAQIWTCLGLSCVAMVTTGPDQSKTGRIRTFPDPSKTAKSPQPRTCGKMQKSQHFQTYPKCANLDLPGPSVSCKGHDRSGPVQDGQNRNIFRPYKIS